jgi:membrane-bound inhibitor of C-type lysozyme
MSVIWYTEFMKKTLPIIFIIVIIIFGAWYFTSKKGLSTSVISTATYQCKGGKIIGAKFYDSALRKPVVIKQGEMPVPTGFVDITLDDGRSMHLMQTISASGVRYANKDESFVFWTKGTGVIIIENGKQGAFVDCEQGTAPIVSASTSQIYINSATGFSVIMPRYTAPPALTRTDSYMLKEAYTYGLNPGTEIKGVNFVIPSSFAKGTNLSEDSYISIEHLDAAKKCTADLFLEGTRPIQQITENGISYTVAHKSGAGAGNLYEESVYATLGKNTCLAVRYFIHYGVFENYPAGTVKEFDKQALINKFDAIRKTLVVQK